MVTLVSCAAVLVTAAAAVTKFCHYRRSDRDHDLRYLTLALGFLALCAALAVPATRPEPYASGWHAAQLAGQLVALAAAYWVARFTAFVANPLALPRALRPLAVGAVLVAVLADIAFTLAGVPPRSHTGSVTLLAVFPILVLGTSLGWLGTVLRRYSRSDVLICPPLRASLRVTIAGSGTGIMAAAWHLGVILTLWLAPDSADPLHTRITPLLLSSAIATIAAGVTYPGWGPPLTRWVVAPLARRYFHQLTPLWRQLIEHLPEVALDDTGSCHTMERLYRRVIEIRDVMLRLAPYQDPRVFVQVDQLRRASASTHRSRIRRWLSGSDWDAITEAATLVTALDAYHLRRRSNERLDPVERPVPGGGQHRTMLAEARMLGRVARALTDSQLVWDIHAQLAPNCVQAQRKG